MNTEMSAEEIKAIKLIEATQALIMAEFRMYEYNVECQIENGFWKPYTHTYMIPAGGKNKANKYYFEPTLLMRDCFCEIDKIKYNIVNCTKNLITLNQLDSDRIVTFKSNQNWILRNISSRMPPPPFKPSRQ